MEINGNIEQYTEYIQMTKKQAASFVITNK